MTGGRRAPDLTSRHIIFDDKEKPYFDLISNFTIGPELISYYLTVFSISFLFFFVLVGLARRIGTERSGKENAGEKSVFTKTLTMLKYFVCEQKSLSSIEVFLLALTLYIWFNQLFICNNIKVNKVVSLFAFEQQCSVSGLPSVQSIRFFSGGRHK